MNYTIIYLAIFQLSTQFHWYETSCHARYQRGVCLTSLNRNLASQLHSHHFDTLLHPLPLNSQWKVCKNIIKWKWQWSQIVVLHYLFPSVDFPTPVSPSRIILGLGGLPSSWSLQNPKSNPWLIDWKILILFTIFFHIFFKEFFFR